MRIRLDSWVVPWLEVAVALGVIFIAIWFGAMRGGSIQSQEMARPWVDEHSPEKSVEDELESMSGRERDDLDFMSYEQIANKHAEEVQQLDGLLHPYQAINGIVCTPLFTDDYYRDPGKYWRRWQRLRDWHAEMAEKYRQTALFPWESVRPAPLWDSRQQEPRRFEQSANEMACPIRPERITLVPCPACTAKSERPVSN